MLEFRKWTCVRMETWSQACLVDWPCHWGTLGSEPFRWLWPHFLPLEYTKNNTHYQVFLHLLPRTGVVPWLRLAPVITNCTSPRAETCGRKVFNARSSIAISKVSFVIYVFRRAPACPDNHLQADWGEGDGRGLHCRHRSEHSTGFSLHWPLNKVSLPELTRDWFLLTFLLWCAKHLKSLNFVVNFTKWF